MKYPADISSAEYAAMEEGYEQGRASAAADRAVFHDLILERDHWRNTCGLAVQLIEKAPQTIVDSGGTAVGIILSVEVWHQVRFMLLGDT